MAVNDIGRVTPIWRGIYSAERAYERNDIVLDAGGSVWWHVSEEITTGTAPGSGETWAAVIDMRIFSAAIQTAIAEAQAAVEAAEAARSGVTADADRAETAAENAETFARNASESAASVGAYAQAAETAKTAAETAKSGAETAQAAAETAKSGAEAAKTGAETAQTAAETAQTGAETAASQAAGSAETASGAAAVVEAKKTEALTEIETTGEEVLESIPADYTALNKEVEDLTADLPFAEIPSINVYDDANPNILTGILGSIRDGTRGYAYNTAGRSLWLQLEPNTDYTVAYKTAETKTHTVGLFPGVPESGEYQPAVTVQTTTSGDYTYARFTTTENACLVFYYYKNADGGEESAARSGIMVYKGHEIYPYTPYGTARLLRVSRENLSDDGAAGQVLMLGMDGEELIWGTPSVPIELDDTLTQTGEAADAKAAGDAIAALEADLENQLGQVVLQSGAAEWLNAHPDATAVIKLAGGEDVPDLGEDLIPGNEWTSTGWTAEADGFTHVTGNTNALSVTIDGLVTGALYQFTITTTDCNVNGISDFDVSLGGSDTFETYRGGNPDGGRIMTYTYGLICGASKVLSIIPRSDYVGTVSGMTLRRVSNSVGIQYALNDSSKALACQIRTTDADNSAIYIGENAGEYAFWGTGNTAVGNNALAAVTSGFWNTAVGRRALEANLNGSRNIAIGYIALLHNTGGDRNVAVGTFALEKNTTGRGNVAINADSMQNNISGDFNIAVGVASAIGNKTGSHNIALGNRALARNDAGSRNIAIGHNALTNAKGGNNNIAIGYESADVPELTGSNNIMIGASAYPSNPAGSNQMVLGGPSISSAKIGGSSLASVTIGESALTTVVIGGKKLKFNSDGTVTWENA